MQQAEHRAGNIYDLGYRHYDGLRLGRRAAVLSLYLYTLRGAFGLGRRTAAKIMPVAITIIAFVPAVVQLGFAALVPGGDIEIIRPENYFGFVQVPVALFCAAVAPEICGRDMRQRTLSLYFSRALSRTDYALAKLAAFATAIAFLTLVPQVVLVLGNGLASDSLVDFVRDSWEDFPLTIAAGAALAVTAAAVSLAIASQSPRRSYATVAVVAWFLLTLPIAGILVFGIGGIGKFAVFLSPFDFMYGAVSWIFNVDVGTDSTQDEAGFDLWTYGVALAVYTAAGIFFTLRRFARIAA